MIMRADGAFRVMLNSPVFKGMNFGDAEGAEPASKQILLASLEEGRTVPLLLRVSDVFSLVVLTLVLILHTDWKRVLHQGTL
jgi:Ran-binding protein 3